MVNLGSLCLYIFYYIAKIVIFVLLYFCREGCGVGGKKFQALKKQIFWYGFISLTLDGYIEFIVCGILNVYAP